MIHALLPSEPDVWADWARLTPSEHGDQAFTAEECDRWLALADSRSTRPGLIGKVGDRDDGVRSVEIADLPPDDDTAWLYDKLSFIARGVNAAWWQLDLTHIDNVEVLRYVPGGHYVEHVDWTAGFQTRKLSLVVMLSDPDDYEGGDLLIKTKAQPMVAPKERGAVTLFPSWTLHAVTPVTAGVRRTATAWVQGPAYR